MASEFAHRSRQRPAYFWAVCSLILIGVALRALYLDHPVRGDEVWSMQEFILPPLPVGLSTYWTTNNHLFHTLLAHLALIVFGNDPRWLRLPTFFAGILMIPATYTVGRVFYNSSAGLLAAALVAASTILTSYSTNARGYTLIAFITLLLIVIATRLLKQPQRRNWIAFAVLAALGLYTVPTMAYPLAIVSTWLALNLWARLSGMTWRRVTRNLVLTLLGTGAITLVLYLPALLYMASGVETRRDFDHLQPMAVGDFLAQVVPQVWTIYRAWTRALPLLVELILVIGIAASVLLHRRMTRQPISLLAVGLIVSGGVALVQRVEIIPRVWLFLLPIVLISGAAGVVYLIRQVGWRRWERPCMWNIVVVVLAIGLSATVVATDAVYLTTETGNVLLDSEAVFEYLREREASNETNEAILCRPICTQLLAYHRDRAGATLEPFVEMFDPETAPAHLLLILYWRPGGSDPENQIEAQKQLVYEETGFDLSRYSEPQELRSFPYSVIYTMERLD